MDYPNDGDGDALRRLASDGNDMSASMLIDFPVGVPDEARARRFAPVAAANGFQVEINKDEDYEGFDVNCSVRIIPTYADVVRIQRDLTELARPFGGSCEAWGSFGNKSGDAVHDGQEE